MWLYVWTSAVKEAYIGKPSILSYDFTTSAWWWTASSWTSRSSSWFYRSWTYSDWGITAPAEIFTAIPKKIILTYNKVNTSSGTWFAKQGTSESFIFAPYDSSLNYWWFKYNGWSVTKINAWWNPTWNVTWEMDIDSSTTNRTVTHKVTWLSNITDNYWIIKDCWNNGNFYIRVLNLTWSTGSIYIKWVTIEY